MPQVLTGVNGGTFPNTCTGPSPGDLITAASVNNGLQGVLNECKFLYDTKANLAGATFTGPVIFSSTATFNGNITGAVNFTGLVTCSGGLTVPTGQTLTTDSGSTSLFNGDVGFFGAVNAIGTTVLIGSGSRLQVGVTSRSNQYVQRLADGDHTVTAAQGGIVLLEKPTTARTITVSQAADTGKDNFDAIQFYMAEPGANVATDYYLIKREGSANSICLLDGSVAGQTEMGMVRIHLEGSVWRGTGGIGFNRGTDW